jgi:hypothetical protein
MKKMQYTIEIKSLKTCKEFIVFLTKKVTELENKSHTESISNNFEIPNQTFELESQNETLIDIPIFDSSFRSSSPGSLIYESSMPQMEKLNKTTNSIYRNDQKISKR